MYPLENLFHQGVHPSNFQINPIYTIYLLDKSQRATAESLIFKVKLAPPFYDDKVDNGRPTRPGGRHLTAHWRRQIHPPSVPHAGMEITLF